MQTLSAPSIHPPFAAYSHAVVVPEGSRLAFVSGQLGIASDGTVPEACEAQVQLCFANIAAILADGGMTCADVVRINAFVTDRLHLAPYMSVRGTLFFPPYPASTLMIVAGFARPEFKVEVEVVAAQRAER